MMNPKGRWLEGPRFLGLGTVREPAHALKVNGNGEIETWAPRVPASWTGDVEALPGAVALPGLHDAHLHLDWIGAFDEEVDLGGVESVAALRGRIEAVLNWVKVRGYRDGENETKGRAQNPVHDREEGAEG